MPKKSLTNLVRYIKMGVNILSKSIENKLSYNINSRLPTSKFNFHIHHICKLFKCILISLEIAETFQQIILTNLSLWHTNTFKSANEIFRDTKNRIYGKSILD